MGRKSVLAEDKFKPGVEENLDALCGMLELDGDKCFLMKGTVLEIIEEAKVKPAKKKRKPSEYNIFIGECVPKKTGPVKERFKECVIAWKKRSKK